MGNTSGFAITSMVLGICSLALFWLPVISVILLIGAAIFGIIGLKHVKSSAEEKEKKEGEKKEGKGMAIAGLIMAGVALILFIVVLVITLNTFEIADSDNLMSTSEDLISESQEIVSIPESIPPDQTKFAEPIPNTNLATGSAKENSFELSFRNNAGEITLPLTTIVDSGLCANPVLNGTYMGRQITPTTVIPYKGEFTLKWTCDAGNVKAGDSFGAYVTFDFIYYQTGREDVETGTVFFLYNH